MNIITLLEDKKILDKGDVLKYSEDKIRYQILIEVLSYFIYVTPYILNRLFFLLKKIIIPSTIDYCPTLSLFAKKAYNGVYGDILNKIFNVNELELCVLNLINLDPCILECKGSKDLYNSNTYLYKIKDSIRLKDIRTSTRTEGDILTYELIKLLGKEVKNDYIKVFRDIKVLKLKEKQYLFYLFPSVAYNKHKSIEIINQEVDILIDELAEKSVIKEEILDVVVVLYTLLNLIIIKHSSDYDEYLYLESILNKLISYVK